jgi:hypothetical protein
VTGLAATDRTYDGTTTVAITGTPTLATPEAAGTGATSDGVPYSGDVVSLSGTAAGVFADQNAGSSKAVTVTGLTLTGAQASNYSVAAPAGITANVTAKPLTATGLGAADKTYDATLAASLTGTAVLQTAEAAGAGSVSDGKPYTGDTVAVTGTAAGTFASKDVASGIAVTVSGLSLTGAQATNYSLTAPAGLTASITPKTVLLSGLSAVNKVYDGTTAAGLAGAATLLAAEAPGAGTTSDGKPYTGDTVSATGTAVGVFAAKSAGTNISVTVSGLGITGVQAGNYVAAAPAGLAANITAKALSVTGLTGGTRVYDGSNSGPLTGTAALLTAEGPGTGSTADGKPYSGDTVSLVGTPSGAFASKNVGTSLAITVTGLSVGGAQASNYSLTAPAGLTGSVTAKSVTVTGITASSKTYDGTTAAVLNTSSAALSGVVTGDTVTVSAGSAVGAFADANAGTGKTVTITGVTIGGADATNYSLTAPTATASITQGTATLTLSNLSQTYDGSPKAVTVTAAPVIATTTTYNGSATPPTSAGTYAVSAASADANYNAAATGTLTIAPASQTISFSLGTGTIGAVIPLSATASSGLPVTFTIVSGSATLSGSTLTITGPGSLTIRASQAGNGNYLAASRDATITGIPKLDQTITFAALSDKRSIDGTFALSASASSGLPVTLAVTSGPAILAGNTLTLTGASGRVSVRASQPGNALYNAAPDVTQSFVVVPSGPLIYFGTAGGSDMAAEVAADSSSGTMIGTLPGTGEGFVVNFKPSSSGDWSATVTTFTGRASAAASAVIAAGDTPADGIKVAALIAADAAPVKAAALTGSTRTFRGHVSGSTLTGSIDDLNVTFTASLVPPTGPTAPIAGYYQSSSLKTADGSIYSIVGTTNQVYVLAIMPDYVGGSSGTAAANGTFNVQAPGQTTITGAVDAPSTEVTGTLSRPSRPAENFAGLAVTTIRTDHLINLSSRARITSTSQLIAGFVIGGSEPKTVLLRAVGPSLAGIGLPGALPAARLRLYDGSGQLLREVSGWSDDAALPGTFGRLGAFALNASNADSALIATLAPGVYTMQVTSPSGASGVALTEIYDASANPAGEYQRLVNISSRGTVSPGDGALIGGFVVSGNSPKRLLIRAAGPTLQKFGVDSPLADPAISIHAGDAVIAMNDNWGTPVTVNAAQTAATADGISAAIQQVGAFAFAAGSSDSAVIVTLAPGAYSAVVTSANGGTGTALIEVYEIPAN